ncbi:MmgE/PrpD family protein [Nocardioides sp. cx-173]|uniref:MmgE/PrpD family protein n=1 Tax=Nocardioides sp. cx-173 TaxID=2898796 RepID=UPI001E621543|nr:MmgE/PrpD family protein [Nocardioides sp. cx-173]MCD4525267.1 MmgE/PrpD family protein [Nocardioides sp. cx-173]UGB40931.1 MmgE/PrpD family protein [Nocardioides sp. cx-173]
MTQTVPHETTRETASEDGLRGLGATQALAQFVSGLRFEDLPAEVVHKAKLLLRDGLGNQLAASTMAEPARVAHGLIEELGGTPQATITGYGTRVPVPQAAMINAMLGHGVELDDAHGNALTKSGSLLVPTVMTTGEHLGRSGRDTLAALVAGYDVIIRTALAINPGHRKRGYHTTGVVGTIASAAASARQYGFDAERTADALGLGAMQAAGIQAYLDSPCMAKPLSPGKAAFNGTLATMLVNRGFTGPKRGLESPEGFFNAYGDGVNLDEIFVGLGSDFKVMEVGFKPHAACRYSHGPIDAAQAIRGQASFELDDVAHVKVFMCELAIRQSGRTVVPNLNAAMGSTPFSVALALLRGANGLADYELGFADQRAHEVAAEVELVAEPAYGLMGRQAVVEVTLRDGSVLRHAVEGPKGEPELPLTEEELETKFVGLAQLALGEARAREVSEQVMAFEQLDNVADLASTLVRA